MLMRNLIANGIFVGFAATLITSIVMVLLRARGKKILDLYLFFGREILGKKVKAGTANMFALVLHLVLGTLIGLVYVLFFAPSITTGLLYALIPWVAMMLVVFPISSQGLFAMKMDKKKAKIKAWMLALFFHLIYGLMLGWFAAM